MEREVCKVVLPAKNKKSAPQEIAQDEEFTNIQLDKVSTLPAAFQKVNGTVTAANASKLSDGATAMIMMSGKEAKARQLTPLFRVLGYGDACKDPVYFTTAPADCVPKAVAHVNATSRSGRAPLSLKDIEYHEINEAFSVVALANAKYVVSSAV